MTAGTAASGRANLTGSALLFHLSLGLDLSLAFSM